MSVKENIRNIENNMSIIQIKEKYKMNDEEIVQRLFRCINTLPDKKDYFIRDFEEYFF